MKKLLLSLFLVSIVLSGCSVLNDVAGSQIAGMISENLTEQVTSHFENLDPEAVAAASSAFASALTISDAEIKALCSEYMASMDSANVILPDDDPYTLRLNRVMKRFKNLGKLKLNYAVYEDENTINAFASGDGSVRVYSGLMDVMGDDELFAVIGHELGHLINKDVRDAYRTAYLVVAARYGISSFSEKASAISLGFWGDLGDELANNAYSRHQETKADEKAYQFCLDNNVDPYAMYHALNVLMEIGDDNEEHSGLSNMFSSHPDTVKRMKHIKDMAEKDGYALEE
jgi:putative metalloprotease